MRRFICALMVLALVLSQTAFAAVKGVSPTATPKAQKTNAAGFSIEPIMWDTACLGQFVLPDGFSYNRMIYNCEQYSSLGFPIQVQVIASSKDSSVRMLYFCGYEYLERVKSSESYLYHQDGAFDRQHALPMRRYTDAAGYCDELVRSWQPDAVFWKEEDMSVYDSTLQERYDKFVSETAIGMQAYGMYCDWADMSASQRVYTYKQDGKEYCILAMAEVGAYQYSINALGFSFTNIIWDVPCYYMLWCPKDEYTKIHDGVFNAFVQNTSVNDEFIANNEKLSAEIADQVMNAMNMEVARSSAYMAAMTALTFSMVESNMNSGSYGSYSGSRFSDYMFDRNEYTLSDGSSVSVSTAYDYVWEGSNGSVYYSNSLFDAPGGATQLYPN